MSLPLPNTTAVQITRLTKALYNAAPGNTYMTAFTADAGTTTAQMTTFANWFAATVSTSAATLASTVVTNIGLTGDAATAGTAYLTAAFAADPSNLGRVILDAMNALSTLTSDATYGTAASTFNDSIATSYAYSINTANTSTNIATLQAADEPTAAGTGQTFTLTTAADTGSAFTGTSGDDTYQGAVVADNGTGTTLTSADNLSGGAGTDTLNVTVSGASTAAVTVSAVTLAGTEKVLVSNFDTNANDAHDHDFNAALWTGVTTLGLTSSSATGDTKFSNVAAIATAEMKSGAGDFEIDYAAAVVAGTADTQTLVLDAVSAGTFTADTGIETVAITAASTASASTLTDLVATGATAMTIDSDVALTITGALDATVLTVDGSASAGALSLNFTAGAADLAVTGGTGNDTFTFDGVGTLTTADTITGGNGTDTLVNTSAQFEALDAAVMTNVTGIEALTISDAATGGETLTTTSFGSINQVNLAAGTAAAYTVSFATGGGTVSLVGAAGGALTIAAAGTATTDAATLTYGDATGDAAAIATTAVETLTINNTKVADTTGTITMGTASTGGTTALVFTGDKTMTTGVITAASVNASALTSTAALVMTGASVGTTSIIGSANGDTLYGIAAAASTIDGGTGNDSITGGSAADNITAGTGNDTIVGAGGNDVITGGDGNDTITALVAGSVNINGGAGNDTITMTATISTGDILAGGDGTDTLSISAADITTLDGFTFSQGGAFNTNMSGFEKVSISNGLATSGTATNILDMSRLDDVNYAILNADGAAATKIQGLAAASTIELKLAQTVTNVLTLELGDATGTSDSITLKLNAAASADFGKSTIASVEAFTVNSTTSNAAPSGVTNTIDLTIASATSVTITGDAALDLSGAVINAVTIDASGNTNAVKVTGSSASQTITGTAGADTIDGGAGADTISGGAGADTITGGTGADSLTGGEAADTIVGAAGNDVIILTEATATVDVVKLTYSEAGTNVDTITGFAKGATGDNLTIDMTALELTGTGNSGLRAGGVVDFVNGDATSVAAAASVLQEVSAAATMAAASNVYAIVGATIASLSDLEDALEVGGAFALTTGGVVAANDAFIVTYSDGANAHLAAIYSTAGAGSTTFSAGDLVAKDLAVLSGITSIAATDFNLANFTFA